MNHLKRHIVVTLTRLQPILKTDIRYLVTGSFWLSLGRVFNAFSGFLIAIAFANLLPVDDFGIYKYIIAWLGILSTTTLLGLNTAVVRAVGSGAEGTLNMALRTKIRWGTFGTLAALCVASYYYIQGNELLATCLLLVGIFVPFFDSFAIYHAYLTGKRLFAVQARNATITNTVVTVGLVTALFATSSVLWILGTYLVLWTSLRVCFYYVTIRQLPPNQSTDNHTIAYGLHLSFMRGISAVASGIVGVVVFQFLGPQGLAIYAVVIAPVEQIRGFIRLSESLLLPKLSSASWTIGRPRSFMLKIAPFLGALVCISAVYALVAPWFFNTFFPAYSSSVILSQLYVVSLMFTGLVVLFQSILKAKARTKELYLNTLLANGLHLIIVPPAIVLAGLQGIIIALIVNKILLAVSAMYLTMRHTR